MISHMHTWMTKIVVTWKQRNTPWIFLHFTKKIEPYVAYYNTQIKSYNDTAHSILKNEINLILL